MDNHAKRRRLLVIGAVAIGGVLILLYFLNQNGQNSGQSSSTGGSGRSGSDIYIFGNAGSGGGGGPTWHQPGVTSSPIIRSKRTASPPIIRGTGYYFPKAHPDTVVKGTIPTASSVGSVHPVPVYKLPATSK